MSSGNAIRDGTPVGQIIRRLREERGWPQAELARRVGNIDAAGVSKIETGVTKIGRVRATRFARALGVEPSLLLPSADPQPTLADVLERLGRLEVRLRGLSEKVSVMTGNQERLLALAEHLVDSEQRGADREQST